MLQIQDAGILFLSAMITFIKVGQLFCDLLILFFFTVHNLIAAVVEVPALKAKDNVKGH
ncbi:hypothetical protein, unlikely [Trypanosoma brucei brucei TREU927]|uniref:Uncharacterized protein n=2 Tax=Trypanosoma brucei TaxID=5691 RepID=Q38FH4_TRYB2|nr:hypothetical protein, unlikely [Trypanosoma brucei brucei TREU927]EAN76446.1 hypothetical protein, unlikely [Trypanosoma brucei brucei TREU927]RHW70458.1 hypothetical protein DPX39_090012700 [Trypanosoma brucei equiperdum]